MLVTGFHDGFPGGFSNHLAGAMTSGLNGIYIPYKIGDSRVPSSLNSCVSQVSGVPDGYYNAANGNLNAGYYWVRSWRSANPRWWPQSSFWHLGTAAMSCPLVTSNFFVQMGTMYTSTTYSNYNSGDYPGSPSGPPSLGNAFGSVSASSYSLSIQLYIGCNASNTSSPLVYGSLPVSYTQSGYSGNWPDNTYTYQPPAMCNTGSWKIPDVTPISQYQMNGAVQLDSTYNN